MRFNEEVLIANEDYQLEVLSTLARGGRQALLRAVDLVAIHGINPLSGEKIPEITNNIAATENQIEMGDDPELDIEGATGLIIADGMLPNGVALDTLHAFNLSTARYQDGRRKFPDIALNVAQPYSIGGLMAATSDTVSAAKEATAATNVKAVVGDWTAARWGIQRDMGVELIRYGDPDGRGDLKRKNQIAMRLEIFFGVGVMDLDAFAVVKAPAA